MFRCRPCRFDTQSLEDFTKHLSSEEHAQKEIIAIQTTRPSVGPEYEQSQIKRMPRNYLAPPEYTTSKTAVWWDMRDCPVPDGYDAHLVRPSIEGALKNLGYSGPVTITAYGDIEQTPEHVLRGLSSTGVSVQHTLKDKRCSLMHTDLLVWQEHNPPPATIMYIRSGGRALLLHSLPVSTTDHGYKLVLAYTSTSIQASALVTSAEWLWGSLLTDSETPRQVVQKYSKTGESAMFRCRSCRFDAQSLEDFTKHLSGEEHAQIEIRIIDQSIRPSTEYKVENFPNSKCLRKAFQTDFHFGNYVRLSNRGSRRGARKEKLLHK